MAIRAPDGANKCKLACFSMFSTCSEHTPHAPIPDGRMEQIMQPCSEMWSDFPCWFDHLPQISMRVQWQVLDLRTNIMSLFSSPFANIFVGKKKSSWKYACFKLFAWLPVPCSFVRKVRQFRNAVETGQLPLHACLANKWPTWMEFVQDFEIAFYLFKVAFLVFNLSLLTFC